MGGMLDGWQIALASACYLGLLFAIAFHADRRAAAGASLIGHPAIYALSLAVYASSWTFYGSVGRAAVDGIGFFPVYLGPTLMAALWWIVLRKMIAVSKANRITSIADFIASRYGKSALLGGLATLVAVVGIVPYIALQLKAVSSSLALLQSFPGPLPPTGPVWSDAGLHVALLLAAFTILFGARHLDAAERHEGMVAAVAFESVVKLCAFLVVGLYVGYGMYDGLGALFARAAEQPALQALTRPGAGASQGGWAWLTLLSMLSILLLPRQFQIAVVENVSVRHVRCASWLLPLYLLAINLFVLPIAFAGLMRFPDAHANADLFVLTLPLAGHQPALALLVFIGGLSAATGMVIVETTALSTMVCNDLAMPLLLRLGFFRLAARADLSALLLRIRRMAIVALMSLGYVYSRAAGEAYALMAIGLISFAAVAQFAPAVLGGLYWRRGNRNGALLGLAAGFLVWLYTLLLPSFARSGWLPASFLDPGPYGQAWLRPYALFGLDGMDPVSHAMFWSMLVNCLAYVGVSLLSRQDAIGQVQAQRFVDPAHGGTSAWGGAAPAEAMLALVGRVLGPAAAQNLRRQHQHASPGMLMHEAEMALAGAMGAASARVMARSVLRKESLAADDMLALLDESVQAIAHSRELEQKSIELERASAELRAANQQLTELDRMKDDFLATVTHELRTPLTSIRAFSEILRDHPDLPAQKRAAYLDIIIRESERLTRLINDVLDLAKLDAGRAEWHAETLDLAQVVRDALEASGQLLRDKAITLEVHLPPATPPVRADRDRLMQVMLNLLSNAAKFCSAPDGRIAVSLQRQANALQVAVSDNGAGVRPEDREIIFDKFRQGGDTLTGKPQGTGLGLPISRRIVSHFGGRLWLEDAPGGGARFLFTLPLESTPETAPASPLESQS